jgi:hypothetical protein
MNQKIFGLILMGFLLVLATGKITAQSFAISQIEMEGVKLNIYYVLQDTDETNKYIIKLFSSRDNYSTPLKSVSGDVGVAIIPGNNKKIVFDISKEFGDDFEDRISFQIRGSFYVPFIKLNGSYAKLKRDKSYELTWTGGTEKEILNIELLSGDKKILDFPSFSNEQMYNLKLPASLKVGKPYRLRIYDTNNGDRVVFTNEFLVQRKIPLVVKALPIMALGSIFFFVSRSSTSNHLPDPIKP